MKNVRGIAWSSLIVAVGLTSLGSAQSTEPAPTSRPATRPASDAQRGGASSDFDTIKAELKATDEEWKVIAPQIRKVAAARQATLSSIDEPAAGGFGGGGFGRGMNRGGPGGRFGPPGGPDFGGNSSFIAPGGAFGPPPGGGFGGRGGPGFGPPDGGPDFGPPRGDFNGPDTRPTTRPLDARTAPAPGPDGNPRPQTQPAPNDRRFGADAPGGGGPPGGGPPGFGRTSALQQAMANLQKQLKDTASTPQQVQDLVAKVRGAREQAMRELEAQQKALAELLTPEQQAVMISRGYLY